MVCLHVHRDGAAVGSAGSIKLITNGEDISTIHWYAPWMGTNKAFSDDESKISTQTWDLNGGSLLVTYTINTILQSEFS